MNRNLPGLAAAVCASTLVLVPGEGSANTRRFSYTYESATLAAGDAEFEPWTTLRAGREGFYRRFDHRLEYEAGLTDAWLGALYLNFSSIASGSGAERESTFEYEGVSFETKYKLSDPVADALGSALYLELTTSALEAELEAKLILDKRFGDFLAAANVVGAQEWELEAEGTAREAELELDLGLAYLVTPAFSAGLEVRNANTFTPEEGFEHSALFAGPTVSYASRGWWVTASVQPQLVAWKSGEEGETNGSSLELDDHERIEARVLLGFHL